MPEPSPEPRNTTGATPWKARPVFISSTFRDMQRERDWLNNRVFPRIREELAKRRHHLEPIDLRLGVEAGQAGSEEARELLVLKVCLDEIKRSRPFLLVLLGDRYGWVPPVERIEVAAREQGFKTSAVGKSVTALEIEFGILKEDPGQKHRSLFLFRQPLPYDQMPEAVRADYSDAHSPDARAREGHAKLAALKEKLRGEPELADRIHEYSAGWHEQTSEVTGLEAFGDLVFEKLWAAIDDETGDWAAQPAPTWEEQERAALAEFVEHRSRGFVGRGEIIGQLLGIARSPVVEGAPGATVWGACVTGSPGSGKSAVFARVHRELENDRATLLLANAAGGTGRGANVDSMLRRWISELASAAGVADPLHTNATNEDVDAAFHSLLHRVAAQRRVVALLDALDQAEPTPRGRHLTWFKAQSWPPNARIIATGIPCPATEKLAKLAGIGEIDLPSLTAADAEAIGRHVWGRYHRELNPAVLGVLVGKKLPGGQPACGNPLWLTLALEQLNLLDADDFARAEREFTGSPTERMAVLLLDTAGRMPADVTGLYGWLLERNEKAFGAAHARGFAVAVALSRTGWRETDLLDLVPRLGKRLFPGMTVADLNDLALASLRRGFRAHIVRRGENGQLDFFHAQMRRAVIERCAPEEEARRGLHAAISDYLETLPSADPLIRLERMGQLIGERNALRAARYYATLDASFESNSERLGATWNLVEWIAAGESGARENANLGWITSWLQHAELGGNEVYRLTNNYQFGLFERMENDVVLPTRQRLVEAVRGALQQLATANPSNADWQRDLGVGNCKLGSVLLAQGDLAGALNAYREYQSGIQRLAAADPSNAGWQRELSASHNCVGNVRRAQGDLAGALKAYREYQSGMQRLAAANPSHAGWQRDLCVSHIKVGDVLLAQGDLAGALEAYRETQPIFARLAAADPSNAGWQRDLSVSQERIGDVRRAQGDLAGTLKAYRESLAVRARLVAADPSNAGWQRDLSVSQEKVGNALLAQGDLAGALNAHRESLAVRARLVAADPSNAGWQRDLSGSHTYVGDVLLAQGDLAGALNAYRESLAVRTRLAVADPSNADWQRDLSVSQGKMGDALLAQGDLAGALKAYRESLAVRERLAAADPSNAGWQRGLSVSHSNVGDVLRAQGDLAGALNAYREYQSGMLRLAAAHPSNAGWQRDLSVSQRKIGNVLLDQGDLAGALNAYRESLAMAARLAAADRFNAGWQRDLSVSHNDVGNVQLAKGDLAGALNAYRESLAIRARLAAADPSNAGWQRDLSVSQEKVGNALLAQGDLAGALKAYRESLAVRARLAAADPSNAGWQRDLSVSHGKVGDVLLAQGDLAGALKAYRESLAVRARLAAADPSNAGWQRDLSVSQEKMGDALLAQGNLAGALNAYRESLAVRTRLAAADPSNAGWQYDLGISNERIGSVLQAQGDLVGALSAYSKKQSIISRLAAAHPSNAGWQRDLSVSQGKIGNVLLDQGDLAGALNAYRESLAMAARLAAADPSNAGWQHDLFASYWRMADMAEKGGTGEARDWWRKAYELLSDMKQRGVMLPTDEQYLTVLRQKAGAG